MTDENTATGKENAAVEAGQGIVPGRRELVPCDRPGEMSAVAGAPEMWNLLKEGFIPTSQITPDY